MCSPSEFSLAYMLSAAYLAAIVPHLLIVLKHNLFGILSCSLLRKCCSGGGGKGFVAWAKSNQSLIFFTQDFTVMLKSLFSALAIFYFLRPSNLIACTGITYQMQYNYSAFTTECVFESDTTSPCMSTTPNGTVPVPLSGCGAVDLGCMEHNTTFTQVSNDVRLLGASAVQGICNPKVEACPMKQAYASMIALNQCIFCFCICLRACHGLWSKTFGWEAGNKRGLHSFCGVLSILAFILGW
jgi:hypothetical protein